MVSISDDILSTEQSDLETDILIGCVNNTWDGFVYISETIYFSLDIVSEGRISIFLETCHAWCDGLIAPEQIVEHVWV